MRQDILLYILGALLVAGVITSTFYVAKSSHNLRPQIPEEISQLYSEWKQQYGVKNFDQDTENYKLGVFYSNYKWIQENTGTEGVTFALNQFADITPAEFKATYLGYVQGQQSCGNTANPPANPPSSVDWRQKEGILTPVKNQEQCGSCWAFSTVESLESEDALHGTGLSTLSPQQLVDCSGPEGNQGCNGGLMDQAFKYVIENGITTEADYPYTAQDGTCNTSVKSVFKIAKCYDIPSNDCDTLKASVAQQPVSVAVDASGWQFYSGGVFPKIYCGKELDHGVQAVGYNEKGQWFVRNSWGASWGESGFITLKEGNTCGICQAASYPSVN